MTNGITYFVIEVGSKEPPGIGAAKAFPFQGISSPAPANPLAFRNCRLVIMVHPFS